MSVLQHVFVAGILLYRWVGSPLKQSVFGPDARCRFDPTCSAYALQAVRQRGALRGGWLALKRICRCHPWGSSGHDPVPAVVPNDPVKTEGRWSRSRDVGQPLPPSGPGAR